MDIPRETDIPREMDIPRETVMPRETVAQQEHRIVVGVDGSEFSIRALGWAAREAQFTGAVLDVITTWRYPNSYGFGPLPEEWDPSVDAQKVLEEALEPVAQAYPGVTVKGRTVEGHPAPVLVEASRGAELLAIGSRGHGELAGVLLGSVSEHCVTHAHCPVLVLRDS